MPVEHGPRPTTPDADSPGSTATAGEAEVGQCRELWSWLPRISPRQARLEEWLARWTGEETLPHWLDWIRDGLKQTPEIGRPEIVWSASGLARPGLIAQFRWPSLNTRLALGLEVPLAHAVVDHLLGYDRPFAESRLQLTPVEWGVWTYLVVRSLEGFCQSFSRAPWARDDHCRGRPPEPCARPGRSRSVRSGRPGRRRDTSLVPSRRIDHGDSTALAARNSTQLSAGFRAPDRQNGTRSCHINSP